MTREEANAEISRLKAEMNATDGAVLAKGAEERGRHPGAQNRTSIVENEAKLAEIIKDLREIGNRIGNIQFNLLPPERKADDAETIALRWIERNLIGDLTAVAKDLFTTVCYPFCTGADLDDLDLSSKLQLLLCRCRMEAEYQAQRARYRNMTASIGNEPKPANCSELDRWRA